MSGSGSGLAPDGTVFAIVEDMLILLSKVKSDRRKAHFYGNLTLAQSLENQRLPGLRFPYPLLSNVLLTSLDRELERRKHRFVRYADDVVIHVRSKRAGQRVLDGIARYVETALKLRVSETKSAVARPSQRTFLGCRIDHRGVLRISTKSRVRLIGKLRQLLRRARGRSLRHTLEVLNPVLRGWAAYFKLAHSRSALQFIDGWVRRKLRCILWRQWKRPYTRLRYLQRLGLPEQQAWKSSVNGRGPWWNAGARHMHLAMPKVRFDRWGLVSVLDTVLRLQRVT